MRYEFMCLNFIIVIKLLKNIQTKRKYCFVLELNT